MQEHRIDGPDILTEHGSQEQLFHDLKVAFEDERNSAITLHKPGSIVRSPIRGMKLFRGKVKQGDVKPGGRVVIPSKQPQKTGPR